MPDLREHWTKKCEICGEQMEKQPGWAKSYWEKRRYCSVECLRSAQRNKGRTGSEGRIKTCEFELCSRTFWAVGMQRFCRDPRCQDQRNFARSRDYVKKYGTSEDLASFDEEARVRELNRLIDEQKDEARNGDRAYYGCKYRGATVGLGDLLPLNGQSDFGSWADLVSWDRDLDPFPRAQRHAKKHSYVPRRRKR